MRHLRLLFRRLERRPRPSAARACKNLQSELRASPGGDCTEICAQWPARSGQRWPAQAGAAFQIRLERPKIFSRSWAQYKLTGFIAAADCQSGPRTSLTETVIVPFCSRPAPSFPQVPQKTCLHAVFPVGHGKGLVRRKNDARFSTRGRATGFPAGPARIPAARISSRA